MELAGWPVVPTKPSVHGEGNTTQMVEVTCLGHQSCSPVDRVLSACKVHGTRKVVNYTILC